MNLLQSSVIVAFAACLCACSSSSVKQEVLPKVKLQEVEAAAGEVTVQYPGRVKAADDLSLSFRVSGQISHFHVDEGQPVRKGQLLVELDATDYQTQLNATEAEYKQLKAEAERVIALYDDSVATENDYDRATFGLQQIEAKLKYAKDQLSYTKIYAPIDGIIQKRLLESHETVGAGTPVISMVSSGLPEVEIHIPASDYAQRDLFSDYSATFQLFEGEDGQVEESTSVVRKLTLLSISPKANANQLYTLRLQLKADGKPLPTPGMNTMVTITKKEKVSNDGSSTQLKIPAGAVVEHAEGDESGAEVGVFVYNPSSSRVEFRTVRVIELKSDGTCVVESSQLKIGEEVVVTGARTLRDGDKVELIPQTSESNIGGLL